MMIDQLSVSCSNAVGKRPTSANSELGNADLRLLRDRVVTTGSGTPHLCSTLNPLDHRGREFPGSRLQSPSLLKKCAPGMPLRGPERSKTTPTPPGNGRNLLCPHLPSPLSQSANSNALVRGALRNSLHLLSRMGNPPVPPAPTRDSTARFLPVNRAFCHRFLKKSKRLQIQAGQILMVLRLRRLAPLPTM